jgi:hypothetical protein
MERQRVSIGRLFVRHWLWVPLILLAAGVLFSWDGLSRIAEANRLAREGVDTVAIVTGREIRTERGSNGATHTRYYVSYRFNTTSDMMLNTRASVAAATYHAVEIGQSVTVRYLPDNPGTNRLALEGTGRGSGMVSGLVGLALLMAGGGVGWWLLRGKLSALRAAWWGEVREAEVLGHETTNVQVDGRTQYRYTWRDARGALGQSMMMDYARLPQPGAVVRVYIDPRTGRGWSEHDY